MLLFTFQRSFRSAGYRLSFWILLTLQGWCKASEKSSLLAFPSRSPHSQSISLMLCKVTKLFAVTQIIIVLKQRYTTLSNIIQRYTKEFGKFIRKSRLFFVPLYPLNETFNFQYSIFNLKNNNKHNLWNLQNLMVEQSLLSSISLTSCHVMPGRN